MSMIRNIHRVSLIIRLGDLKLPNNNLLRKVYGNDYLDKYLFKV